MTDQNKEAAIQTIKDILHVLHEKRYTDLPACVNEMEWNDMDEIVRYMEGFLGEFELECFDGEIEGEPRFHEYTDGRGFKLDYDLTCGGEPTGMCLQLLFLYAGEALHSIFLMIEYD